MGRRQDGTRARVKAVALELFAHQGYSTTSLREIAERMNFTKAALYYHFRTKDDLLTELLAPVLEEIEALAAEHEGPGDWPDDRRRKLLLRYLDTLLHHRALGALLVKDLSVASHPAVGERVRAARARVAVLLAGPAPSLRDRLRAAGAISVLDSVFAFPDADGTLLREELLAQATAILDAPRADRRSG